MPYFAAPLTMELSMRLWKLLLTIAGLLAEASQAETRPIKIISAFVGADEILAEILPEAARNHVIFSPLARNKSYSAVVDLIPASAKAEAISIESLVREKPDIVFVAHYTRPDILNLLSKAGAAHQELATAVSLDEMLSNIDKVAEKVGNPTRAAELKDKIKKKYASLDRCPHVTYLNFDEDFTLYGRETGFDFMVSAARGRNLANGIGIIGWKKISLERLVSLNPDFVIATGENPSDVRKKVSSSKGWTDLPAVKAGRIIAVPSRFLTSVTHHLLDGAEIMCMEAKNHAR